MFKRKLQALGFPNPDLFNCSDDKQYQNMIIWLEDQKIRRYKIEEREPMRNCSLDQLGKVVKQYLVDLDCPFPDCPRPEVLDWLLGLAINLEFSEKAELNDKKAKGTGETCILKSNPLDNLDFHSGDFVKGVNQLADLLKITKHPNHLFTLEAICNLVNEKFTKEKLESKKTQQGSTLLQFNQATFGFDIKDSNLSQAANMLCYLFLHDLRNLQTKINECLVSVQALTANPKTDTKLGVVGY
nr:EOG090X0ARU [Ilyocryptus agilis]